MQNLRLNDTNDAKIQENRPNVSLNNSVARPSFKNLSNCSTAVTEMEPKMVPLLDVGIIEQISDNQ